MKERLDCPLPIERVVASLRERTPVTWLDSGSHDYGLGRFSILVADPVKAIRFAEGVMEVSEEGEVRRLQGDPFALLRAELGLDSSDASNDEEIPFYGGAVGYFGYDFGRRLKPSTLGGSENAGQPDFRFGVYDAALIWDHQKGQLYAAASERAERPEALVARLKEAVEMASDSTLGAGYRVGEIRSNFSREVYLDRVERTRKLIRQGEIYQANLSQRFSASFSGSAFDLYRRLREVNPAPYSAYLDFGDEIILSSSPERFLHHRDGKVDTRPIKGTRPRGENQVEEDGFRRELEESEKDRAELLMIVDLERNDLGRVCHPGSIQVSDLFALETYASVIHQTATVSGDLASGRDVLDCVEAMFPGGSITGAPKIRAMEVIDSLESGRRGVYTGSIGYIGFDGRADFNIAIRTMRIANEEIAFNVGGGIVWDSDPQSEYEETFHKAEALLRALKGTGGDA